MWMWMWMWMDGWVGGRMKGGGEEVRSSNNRQSGLANDDLRKASADTHFSATDSVTAAAIAIAIALCFAFSRLSRFRLKNQTLGRK